MNANVSAKHPVSQSLGNLVRSTRQNQTLLLETDAGEARVTVYSPEVIRVQAVKEYFTGSHSYAVVASPVTTYYSLEETSSYCILKTSALQLKITKNPVRFDFQTHEGEIINQDDPGLGISWLGEEVGAYKILQEDERFIGLGEKTGNLDRRGAAYVNWNTDNPKHQPGDDPLYVSIPFYIGIHSGLNYGVFFDNSHLTRFNFGASNDRFSCFTAEAGEMDYYFIYHKTVRNIIRSYTWLTGRMPLPPKWALGYQQCRWSYYPDSEILSIARTFREKKIPADVIYFDIDHMQDYKLFTWSEKNFPRPSETIDKLREMDFHSAVIIDPGVKIEKDYPVYEEGLANDVFIKYPDEANYTASVWPGRCHFPDFTKLETRKWWGEQFKELVGVGVEGFWNDMNEIASHGGATPRLVEFDWEGEKTTYRKAKNVYGMLMARATYEGVKNFMETKRPMILTRAGFAGLQRHSALWTGDNQASEDHMMLGVRLVNSLGVSGVSFAGVDVGGFGGDASKELFARWMTIGAFTPFFRGHSAYDTRASEPWAYGETVEEISRTYIQLRYNLMPYLYSVFYESHLTGVPVARSLAMDYTHDDNVYKAKFENQYLFGPAILVAPNTSDQKFTKVYLPGGQWYDFFDDSLITGGQEIVAESPLERLPLFVKAGSIIPVQSAVQSTSRNPGSTLYIHLYKGDQSTHFVYYEDDGKTDNYKSGVYCKRDMKYKPSENCFLIDKAEGTYRSYFNHVKLILHGFDSNKATVNGETQTIEEQNFNFIDPPGNSEEQSLLSVRAKVLHLDNFDEKIDVRFG